MMRRSMIGEIYFYERIEKTRLSVLPSSFCIFMGVLGGYKGLAA